MFKHVVFMLGILTLAHFGKKTFSLREKEKDVYLTMKTTPFMSEENSGLIFKFLESLYKNKSYWEVKILIGSLYPLKDFSILPSFLFLIGQIFIKNSNETQNMTFLPWVKFKMNIISKNYSSSDLMLKKVILVEGLLEEHLLKNVESEEKNDLISKLKTLVKIGKVEIMKNLCEAIELFDKNSSENVIFLNDIDTVYYFGGRFDVVVEDSGIMNEYFLVGKEKPRFISENFTCDFNWKEHVDPNPNACLTLDSQEQEMKSYTNLSNEALEDYLMKLYDDWVHPTINDYDLNRLDDLIPRVAQEIFHREKVNALPENPRPLVSAANLNRIFLLLIFKIHLLILVL